MVCRGGSCGAPLWLGPLYLSRLSNPDYGPGEMASEKGERDTLGKRESKGTIKER